MAHTLGTLYHIPHGVGCGLTLPHVMRYNIDHATEKYAKVAEAFGVDTTGMSTREAGLAAADAMEHFLSRIGHPLRLRDLEVPEDQLPLLAAHAINDINNIMNPRPVVSPDEVLEVFKQCY